MNFLGSVSPTSVPAFLLWRARGRTSATTLRLREGLRLHFRPLSRTSNDYGLAYEIFVHRYYDCPRAIDRAEVRLIVDLGCNVGFTPLYWAANYAQAEVIAYEPHPTHVAQCKLNLKLNSSGVRVGLRPVAAGPRAGRLRLSDAGTSSAAVPDSSDGFDVAVEDCLDDLAGRRIDILKIDIEGGEYEIMSDERFALLDVRRIVMEWHRLEGGRDGVWCVNRLRSLGFDVEPIFDEGSHGMLWAFRSDAATR
jgi:FkbM family methyltransferase